MRYKGRERAELVGGCMGGGESGKEKCKCANENMAGGGYYKTGNQRRGIHSYGYFLLIEQGGTG